MLEAQIARKATFSTMLPDRLCSKAEPNPRKQCNAMILREGKQLEGPKGATHNESLDDKNEDTQSVEESSLRR